VLTEPGLEFENVLAKIRGADISAASKMLPSAETDTVDERTTEITVPHIGVVQFFFKRLTAKKGKARRRFWCAERAVVIVPVSQ
jgi:hypothetical protein